MAGHRKISSAPPSTAQNSGKFLPPSRPLCTALPARTNAQKTARATEPQNPSRVLTFISVSSPVHEDSSAHKECNKVTNQ
jgi:hypothetical protein